MAPSFLDFEYLSVDDVMKSKVKSCDGVYACQLCGSITKHWSTIRRHVREVHLSSDKSYCCPPPCNKYYKNRRGLYQHFQSQHKDWKGIDYNTFAVGK